MSVGAALAQARIERGLTVEDVSATTRIRAGLIRQIEADDFSGCGGAVYARGHIRSIAHTVGADPGECVALFDHEHADETPATVATPLVPAQPTDAAIAARVDRKGPNWAAAMAVVLVVVCVAAAVGLLRGSGKGSGAGNAGGGLPAPVTTTAAPSPAAPVTPPPSAVAQVQSNEAIALVRVNRDKTWLQVETFSGRLLFSDLLYDGQTKLFKDAHGLRLVIGNAPVVQLVADGREIGAPRSSGNVAHVTVQPGGQVEFA